MEKKPKRFFSQPTWAFGKKRRKKAQSPRRIKLPPELFLAIILSLDPNTLAKLALSCRWLFREISNRKRLWEECYYETFSFNRDDRELKWLQQLQVQQRPSNSSTAFTDSKPGNRRAVRKVRREKKPVEIDWFRAYCWRQQTAYNLSYFTPLERTISLPKGFHQNDWELWSANPLCLVFWSRESNSLLTYQPASSVVKESDLDKSAYPITTEVPNKMGHSNRLTWDSDRRGRAGCRADRDVLVADIDEKTDENIDDTNAFIWRIGPNHRLRTHWPYSSDVDVCPPCKWEVYWVQQDWMVAYTGTPGNQLCMRIYNINHARWCGGIVSPFNFHFRTTTPDLAQVFCRFHEEVNNHRQYTFQHWEYRTYGANERCVKSETITLNKKGLIGCLIRRLNDKQSGVVFMGKDKDNPTDPFTLTLYLTDSSLSLSFRWKVSVSNKPRYTVFLSNREEMIVSTKSTIGYVLNISDGTILHTFNVSFDDPYIRPILGSVCYYAKKDLTNHHIIDTQTGRGYSFSDKGAYSDWGSSEYAMLCAKRHIKRNQLTILDWYGL